MHDRAAVLNVRIKEPVPPVGLMNRKGEIAMNRLIAVAMLLAVVLITAGCADKEAEEQAIKTVIQNNLISLQEENLENYMATLHPESPGYSKMELLCPKIFEIYDLEHKLVKLDILDVSKTKARVRTTQEARRISGPENFRDNRSTTTHTLKKYNGEWKLFETKDESSELID